MKSLVTQHTRYDYSPLTERKDYSWPGGKRLAFCLTTNIEVHRVRQGARATTTPSTASRRRQRNYSWRDYGNRIGIWRLVRSGRRARHAARPQHQQPALRLRAADLRAHTRARRRDRRARPHQLPRTSTTFGGKRTRRASSARSPRPSRATKASRRRAGWAAARTRTPGRPTCSRKRATSTSCDWPCDDQPIWMRTRSGPDSVGAVSGRAERFARRSSIASTPRASSATCWSISSRKWSSRARSIRSCSTSRSIRTCSAIRSGCDRCAARCSTASRQQAHGPRVEMPARGYRRLLHDALRRGSFPEAEHAPVLPGKQSGLRSQCAVRWRRPGSDPVKLLILRRNPARHRPSPRSLFAGSFLPSPGPNRAQPAAYAIELHSACSADLNP